MCVVSVSEAVQMTMDTAEMTDARRGRPRASPCLKKEVMQVALDARTRRRVTQMAEREGRAISDVLRELVALGLAAKRGDAADKGGEQKS